MDIPLCLLCSRFKLSADFSWCGCATDNLVHIEGLVPIQIGRIGKTNRHAVCMIRVLELSPIYNCDSFNVRKVHSREILTQTEATGIGSSAEVSLTGNNRVRAFSRYKQKAGGK